MAYHVGPGSRHAQTAQLMEMYNHLSHIQDGLQTSVQTERNIRITNENTLVVEIEKLQEAFRMLEKQTQQSQQVSSERIAKLEHQRDDMLARQGLLPGNTRFGPANAANPYRITLDTQR